MWLLRHRGVIDARAERHRDFQFRRRLYVHLVQADAVFADDFQAGQRFFSMTAREMASSPQRNPSKSAAEFQHPRFRERPAPPRTISEALVFKQLVDGRRGVSWKDVVVNRIRFIIFRSSQVASLVVLPVLTGPTRATAAAHQFLDLLDARHRGVARGWSFASAHMRRAVVHGLRGIAGGHEPVDQARGEAVASARRGP